MDEITGIDFAVYIGGVIFSIGLLVLIYFLSFPIQIWVLIDFRSVYTADFQHFLVPRLLLCKERRH